MEYELKDVRSSVITRIGAALVDIMLVVVLFTVTSSFILNPIVTSQATYKNNYELYSNALVSTGLYAFDEYNNGKLCAKIDLYDETKKVTFDVEKYDEYNQALLDFYGFYPVEKLNEYEESKKNSSVFSYNEETKTYVLVENPNADTLYSFFSTSYGNATKYYLELPENANIKASYIYLNNMANLMNGLSFGISLILIYILFPMIFKHGQTLGKKIFSLRVVDSKDITKPARKYQIAIRQIGFAGIVALSYFTFLIPLLLSLILLCIKKFGPHDFASSTLVLDGIRLKSYESGITNDFTSKKIDDETTVVEAEVREIDLTNSEKINEEKIDNETND